MRPLFLENLPKEIIVKGKAEIAADKFDPAKVIGDSPHFRKMDKLSQMAVAVTKLALKEANFPLPQSTAVVMATRFGPVESMLAFLEGIKKYGAHLASAFVFPNTVMNMLTGRISLELGLKGPAVTLIGDLELAINFAADLILHNQVEAALVGYVEEKSEFASAGGAWVYVLAKANSQVKVDML